MSDLEARAAHTAARAVELTALSADRSRWQRIAEVTGLFALGMLAAVGVIPW